MHIEFYPAASVAILTGAGLGSRNGVRVSWRAPIPAAKMISSNPISRALTDGREQFKRDVRTSWPYENVLTCRQVVKSDGCVLCRILARSADNVLLAGGGIGPGQPCSARRGICRRAGRMACRGEGNGSGGASRRTRLLVPQRHHWIDLGRPARRNVRRQDGHGDQECRDQSPDLAQSVSFSWRTQRRKPKGLSDTNVWLSRADKHLANAAAAVAHATNLPVGVVDVERVGEPDSRPFLDARIPVIDFHSLTQETFRILHSSKDAFPALKMKEYVDSCNLLVAYLAYLDASLGTSPPPAP